MGQQVAQVEDLRGSGNEKPGVGLAMGRRPLVQEYRRDRRVARERPECGLGAGTSIDGDRSIDVDG